MKFIVTGATGFVGSALTLHLIKHGHSVLALVRDVTDSLPKEVEQFVIGDIAKLDKLSTAQEQKLNGLMSEHDVFIHTAAVASYSKSSDQASTNALYKINVDATRLFAQQAAAARMKRFVFLSSIKVNGESTTPGKPFTETDQPQPEDHYAKSKWQAEQQLNEINKLSDMEKVILRAPLIYGTGVKGNFDNLMQLVNKGIPLPFGAINNERSLLALDNLVSALMIAAEHSAAANQTFLIADDDGVSTTELLRKMAVAQEKKSRLFPVPVNWMLAAAKLMGKKSVADRLFGSLQTDTTKIRRLLGWRSVTIMEEQLKKIHCARH